MTKFKLLGSVSAGSLAAALLVTSAAAETFSIPPGDLRTALNLYTNATGVDLIYPDDEMRSVRTAGVQGELSPDRALSRILQGTGFAMHHEAGGIAIVHDTQRSAKQPRPRIELAQTMPVKVAAAAAVETVVVTSSKIKGDIQTVPIAITALSQEQLTSRQIAGGPDLVKEVPNLTFTKTNFSGYSIQIRGIGTQAISVTTDPAVAVALNDTPFIRNHFFEQEFYDVGQVEVLRGPQGTLYGRNATAGVVNVISAKPTDQFEAMASADWGNYHNRRYEGMINIPVVDDRLDLRIAGEWTKRDGYSFNAVTNTPIDGRDLWSTRVTLGLKPTSRLQIYAIWEHFQESDDRLRSAKQLCETDNAPTSIGGVAVPPIGYDLSYDGVYDPATYLSQTCKPTSLYSPTAFEVPNGFSLAYVKASKFSGAINPTLDPYASSTQSRNLRVIESTVNPRYDAKNNTVELNADYAVTPSLTFTSQTGFNQDFLFSTEDFNRFSTSPGIFLAGGGRHPNEITPDPLAGSGGVPATAGVFCDPQVGCSDRLTAVDLDEEHAWQFSQELRVSSNFKGPLNFSIGGNLLRYQTEESYFVFINALSIYALDSFGGPLANAPYVPGVTDNSDCLTAYWYLGYTPIDPRKYTSTPSQSQCNYIDPNPIGHLNSQGHQYFLSQNPYTLNSYAGFGEAYYSIMPDLKLTGGLRWTEDKKHFTDIPSELLTDGYGYITTGTVDQEWNQLTGRAAADWTPKLDFTDQTLVYASYAHGYKAGGANPPGAALIGNSAGNIHFPIHPLTFNPEFIDAYELGTKNTLLDGGITLNGDIFYYDYKGYQISRIVDRTAINDNFDATVKGAELEAMWEPIPGLKFNFAGGYEHTRLDNGQSSIDLMDRTDSANHPGWTVLRPYPTQSSNCIMPDYVIATLLTETSGWPGLYLAQACGLSYGTGVDPVTRLAYVENPTVVCGNCAGGAGGQPLPPIPTGYIGFDPVSNDPNVDPATVNGGLGLTPNDGEGFAKDLSGHELPNAPHFTTSLSAEYTMPLSENWAATLHSDFYWQSQSWARVFNDRPYDKLRGYSNVNLAVILTSADGWQVMGYLKNIFDTTQITGDFLNSDDSGLTTNIFVTDPRLFGVRVTKNW